MVRTKKPRKDLHWVGATASWGSQRKPLKVTLPAGSMGPSSIATRDKRSLGLVSSRTKAQMWIPQTESKIREKG